MRALIPPVIWKQAASPRPVTDPPIAAAEHRRSTVFARLRQCERSHDFLGAHRHSPSRAAVRSVLPFLHGRCRVFPIRHIAPPHFRQNLPFAVEENLNPNLIHGFLSLPDQPLQTATRSRRPFFHNTTDQRRDRSTDKTTTEL